MGRRRPPAQRFPLFPPRISRDAPPFLPAEKLSRAVLLAGRPLAIVMPLPHPCGCSPLQAAAAARGRITPAFFRHPWNVVPERRLPDAINPHASCGVPAKRRPGGVPLAGRPFLGYASFEFLWEVFL